MWNMSRKITLTFLLKVRSCKLHNNKYMIASTQITNTFAFRAVPVFKLLSRIEKKVLFMDRIDYRLLLKKITNFTDKLLQNYKQLDCEIITSFLKHVSDIYHCFFNLHDCLFKLFC